MSFTLEQIAQLAPDEKSMAAGRQSSAPRLWTDLGISGTALWGSCSGSALYHVAIDLAPFGYRCNCPSRKRPCRHVIGLMLLFSQFPDIVPMATPPDDIARWLDQRKKRSSAPVKTDSPRSIVAPDQQKRRATQREAKVAAGLNQLELWMCDLIRRGLTGLEITGRKEFEEQARRLVDAQAGSLSNLIRRAAEIPGSGKDWPQKLLNELGRLELMIEAYSRIETLPDDLQSDLRQLIGWTISQRDLETQGETVDDLWCILAQKEVDDDRIRTQRNWFYGLNSRRKALVLQFAPGRNPFPKQLLPGVMQQTALTFYPGAVPQRARFREQGEPIPLQGSIPGEETLESVLQSHAEALGKQPWLSNAFYLLEEATLTLHNRDWFLRDRRGQGIRCHHPEPWKLLALTGGEPATIGFEWNGEMAFPLMFFLGDRHFPI